MKSRARHRFSTVTAVLLCALHAWMAASVSRYFSTTSDEIVHLTAGYAYWTASDYRLQPENGNFPQRWASLPLLFQDVRYPSTEGKIWREADVWQLGHAFFHESGNDRAAMLGASRTMIAVLSALLCWCAFVLARSLLGPAAGLVTLILAAFCPTLLAHGGLATSDTAAGLGFMVASLAWWRLLQHVTLSRVMQAGAAVGLLALSKYTVVLFAPIALACAVVRIARPAALRLSFGSQRWSLRGLPRLLAVVTLLIVTAGISVVLIWAAYGFRFSAAPATEREAVDFIQSWETVLFKKPPHEPMTMADGRGLESTDREPGVVQHFVTWVREHRLLPEAYLYGLAFVEKNSRGRLAFFAGEYRMTGWREFFPAAFALKTTLPALSFIGLGFVGLASVSASRRRVYLYRLAPFLILLVVYWAFAINSHLNIGHRHLLPIYGAFYIIAGASVLLVRQRRFLIGLILALLAWHAGESLAIRPDYLAYFNPMAGGPKQAHRLFVDSSLDWGQDLPRLHAWLETEAPAEKVFLSYFGSGSPPHERIKATRFGDGYFDWAPRLTPPALTGGVYCISATMFRRVYTHVRGPWTNSYETTYQDLESWLRHVRSLPTGQVPTESDGSALPPEVIKARLFNYEQLQFGRLCHFLELRSPNARVGYSILIFRLSEEEVSLALKAPVTVLHTGLNPTPTAIPPAKSN